ncbi:hypothetical protein [Bradyrhizobium sediminis]|uniref:hypothetical protein n=1 Tax=Bradyrhizobium sediminis TaxID=2840469 RepID=UPI00352BDB62
MLLPALKAGAPSRIVNVASLGQHPIDFDDIMVPKATAAGAPTRKASCRKSCSVAGKTGLFFNGKSGMKANPQAYDEAARRRLSAFGLKPAGLAAA